MTTLHSFDGNDGLEPFAALVQAANGALYGTTTGGGSSSNGTVFRITLKGTFTTLHNFRGTDGSDPWGTMVQGKDGDFYGTAQTGGMYGSGTVFKITSGGTLTTLHNFATTDGSYPTGALVQATDGNFYGTTYQGGNNSTCGFGNGCGTVFKITSDGTLTTLHIFDSTNGANPIAGVIQATNGSFYGTTYAGGNNDWGTVFRITLSGTLTMLHSFDLADGGQPYGPLVQATSGHFFGTTTQGGTNSDGTVFTLAVGLGSFVKTLPTSGKAGAKIMIFGTDLSGTSSVSFHGTPATFKIVSRSQISTGVPSGATTGKVAVTTPLGVLLSNVPFRVKP